jgi:hypothetical protein
VYLKKSKTKQKFKELIFIFQIYKLSISFFSSLKLKNAVILNMMTSSEQISGFQSGWLVGCLLVSHHLHELRHVEAFLLMVYSTLHFLTRPAPLISIPMDLVNWK